MAAYGSGAVVKSHEEGLTVLNIDIGGGTTKLSVIEAGRIRSTMAVNLGARLVAYDESGIITRLEKGGRRFLADLGCAREIGDRIDKDLCARLAARMAETLFGILSGASAAAEFFVTAPFGELPHIDGVLFSGGVSEYIYGRETTSFGDLGPSLGGEIRAAAEKQQLRVIESAEGIRATVIGASQYTVQLSGETIHVPPGAKLPLHNLRVFVVRVDWDAPVRERAKEAVTRVLAQRDPEVCGSPFALAFSSPPSIGYGAAQDLARGIDDALQTLSAEDRPTALVFEQNVGKVIGGILTSKWSIPCIDEVSLSELDFIDMGEVVPEEGFVPVVVKSLAFGM